MPQKQTSLRSVFFSKLSKNARTLAHINIFTQKNIYALEVN